MSGFVFLMAHERFACRDLKLKVLIGHVIAFLFVSNHPIWNFGFSAALALEQALANLNIALGGNPFVFNKEQRLNVRSLLKRGLNTYFSPQIRQILSRCDNCDIKNGAKRVKKFGQPWLTLTVQRFGVYINCCYSCVCVRPKNFLSLSFFFFFFNHCSPMKTRPGQAEKNEKSEFIL